MKKILAVLGVAASFFAVACNTKVETNYIDRAGREVYVPEVIDRAVVIAPSIYGSLIELGGHEKVVGVDQNTFAQYTEASELKDLGSMTKPNQELIIGLEPQVILTTNTMAKDADQTLFKPYIDAGISVISIPSASSLDEITLDIEFLGNIFRKEQKGKELSNKFKSELSSLKEIGKTVTSTRRRVYSETFYPGIWTTGGQTFQNDIIEAVGAVNIFNFLNGHQKVTEEAIIGNANAIDVIITTDAHGTTTSSVDAIKARTGWNVIEAVKNNDVHIITKDYFNQSNVRSINAIKELGKIVYPEVYANI